MMMGFTKQPAPPVGAVAQLDAQLADLHRQKAALFDGVSAEAVLAGSDDPAAIAAVSEIAQLNARIELLAAKRPAAEEQDRAAASEADRAERERQEADALALRKSKYDSAFAHSHRIVKGSKQIQDGAALLATGFALLNDGMAKTTGLLFNNAFPEGLSQDGAPIRDLWCGTRSDHYGAALVRRELAKAGAVAGVTLPGADAGDPDVDPAKLSPLTDWCRRAVKAVLAAGKSALFDPPAPEPAPPPPEPERPLYDTVYGPGKTPGSPPILYRDPETGALHRPPPEEEAAQYRRQLLRKIPLNDAARREVAEQEAARAALDLAAAEARRRHDFEAQGYVFPETPAPIEPPRYTSEMARREMAALSARADASRQIAREHAGVREDGPAAVVGRDDEQLASDDLAALDDAWNATVGDEGLAGLSSPACESLPAVAREAASDDDPTRAFTPAGGEGQITGRDTPAGTKPPRLGRAIRSRK